ncbi:hypothetical protein GCM10011534_12360 [Pseudooceanicola nanhaiensis]|jgi:hypothetical protein|uniref:Uncharacterized protein n=2 Tax=Pseudooceanicola nanhaiensis TaxID=375761 RepID=A0A917SP48_9RHOB|nr:hypothetical protein [Pseudooceanicola nanhaiensis]GGL91752.1 hypothetical protein GCM10011534_12360 [Pseudooceanicola nanhaiensis]
MLKARWYPDGLMGWVLLHRRLALKVYLHRFMFGVDIDRITLCVFVGPFVLVFYLADQQDNG